MREKCGLCARSMLLPIKSFFAITPPSDLKKKKKKIKYNISILNFNNLIGKGLKIDKKCTKLIGIKFGTKKVHNLVHFVHFFVDSLSSC